MKNHGNADHWPQYMHNISNHQIQAEVNPTLFTFAEACAQPNAKRLTFHGLTGPVNAVEVDGTFFVENEEAEAKAARLKMLELDPEVGVAPKAAANSANSAVAAAPTPMPESEAKLHSEPICGAETSSAPAFHRISYAAAASKPPIGPKPSAAGFKLASKFSERSASACRRALVLAPDEVSMHAACARAPLSTCIFVRQSTSIELYTTTL